MRKLYLPQGYKSTLSVLETQEAIKYIRDNFEKKLCKKLDLTRVSAPLFVLPSTGLNDNLSGIERTVSFDINGIDEDAEIVQSLAKWKRYALHQYGFETYKGLYTNMNAIRRDEELDSLHSAYVDQWDWEKIIAKEDRNPKYLKKIVRQIYSVIYNLSKDVEKRYGIKHDLPKDIFFITSKQLLNKYPMLDSFERERAICKEHKAVFLMQIGNKLKNGKPHDSRAADYDDWKLNGDILLYYDLFDTQFELSSMGIRVDEESIVAQIKEKNELDKLSNNYVRSVINKELPYTIGGGIGQSRLCMYMLKKAHIGEVQSSIWPESDIKKLQENNINLL